MIDHLIRASSCAVSCGSEHGTGYLVRADRVLTARHCVIDAINSRCEIALAFPAAQHAGQEQHVHATVVAEDADLDTCILVVDPIDGLSPIPTTAALPREGVPWVSFGFPEGKSMLGHYVRGDVAQVLPEPRAKVDIDLSVDPNAALDRYQGMSGGAVVIDGQSHGLLRLRVNGTVAAIAPLPLPFTAAGAAAYAGRLGLAAETSAKITSGTDIVTLGSTGIKTTVLGIGTGTAGGREQRDLGQDAFTKLVHAAYERGIRYVDTADSYGMHAMVANAIKGLPREKLFIQTKGWARDPEKAKADIERFRKELKLEQL
ncbi:hypothetical protein LCGC14_3003250, partial [marine sediment metagenome]